MAVSLVTFSDESMSRSRELCASSARAHGIDRETQHEQRLMWASERVRSYPEVFYQPEDSRRAWAHWAWKPLIIDNMMTTWNTPKRCRDNDILIYADAGVEFINNVNYIIDRMDQDIFLFGNNYEHAHWCKRDVIDAVWPDGRRLPRSLMAYGDFISNTWLRFGKQVQASVIFFRVSDYTRKFVKEWLDWCLFEGGRLIDDSPSRTPNHPEFQEHRHDQAILTTLAYREGIKLHYWPAQYNDGAFEYPRGDYPDEGYPILFHHHRKRNADWSAAA